MFKPFIHAFRGIISSFRTEWNMWVHLAAAVSAIVMGFAFCIETWEWIAIIGCIGLVISLELINTAIESTLNLTHPGIHPLAKKAKDAAAGGVLVASITAAIIGGIIFIPKIF